MDVPTTVQLVRCDDQTVVPGEIVTLTREVAKTDIDACWWRELAETLRDPGGEPDRHWNWREIVSVHQNKPSFRAKCIRSPDSCVQAAMLFRVDALSAIAPGQRAVFIDRLATAPRNRDQLVTDPQFRNGGSGLLTYAIAVSYSLGFMGRVNLFPVANQSFYTDKGFESTGIQEEDDSLFEIPSDAAIELLRARGLIDG
ncbi:MAG: hypothetical protein K8T25_19965 [Planctomycetia bacterium]|nr:hypothetical protein [Planctomycetia bacterium]